MLWPENAMAGTPCLDASHAAPLNMMSGGILVEAEKVTYTVPEKNTCMPMLPITKYRNVLGEH